MEKIPEIRGIRGLAVLAVLVYHLAGIIPPLGIFLTRYFPAGISGWSGVDFFFVLSAFLLTKLYYDRLDLRRHYIRRFFRTWPLYYAALPIYVLLIHYPFSPLDLIYGQTVGPFPSALSTPLWTLTIEEIFYAALPLWFLFWHKVPAPYRKFVMLAFALASIAFRLAFAYSPPNDAMDKQLPSFLGDYAIGTWLALDNVKISKPAAAGALFFVSWIYTSSNDHPFSMVSLAFCWGLVLAAYAPGSRFFSSKPMQLIGSWSYAIYILQWPFLVYFGPYIGTLATFAAAGAAHYFLEAPMISLGHRLTRASPAQAPASFKVG